MQGCVSEQDLVRETLMGNLRAFEEIVEIYQQRVFSIIYRLVRNKEEAEDLSQETFLKCYQNLNRYDQNRPFAPWLYRIATNLALSKLRRQQKFRFVPWDSCFNRISETIALETKPCGFSITPRNNEHSVSKEPELVWEEEENKKEVVSALKKLKPIDQTIIILRYFEDLSYDEIAFILKMSRNNVEVRIHRARKRLRKILTANSIPVCIEDMKEKEVVLCPYARK